MFLLLGCAPGSSAIFDTARVIGVRTMGSDAPEQLRPGYHYLRVTVAGRTELLALGYTEPAASTSGASVEVWYSAIGEVLQFQGGRIVATTGLPVDWRNVRFDKLPEWHAVTASTAYSRWRDMMPGYQMNIVEQLVLHPIAPPSQSQLKGMRADDLLWFEEVVVKGAGEGVISSRYAVPRQGPKDAPVVPVYGEHCLSATFCFTWQRWPVSSPPGAS